MSLSPGTIVDDEYTLVRRLGKGGMGEVWEARSGDIPVAIKFVLSELRQKDGIVRRFKEEIRTGIRLEGEHLVKTASFGVDVNLGYYLVMELLQGESLRELLGRGRIDDVRVAVRYALEACDALREAHAHGVVHRDLKPENLFLATNTKTGSASIKVLDFGIARASDELRSQLTQAGGFVGTYNYSSPEQVTDSTQVTGQSDIWSLGAILYELLCGNQAFPGNDQKPIADILTRDPPSLTRLRPELPPGLVACVEQCLARELGRRFASAELLIRALSPFAQSKVADTEAAPPDMVKPRQRPKFDTNFPEREKLVDAIYEPRPRKDGKPRQVVFLLGAGFSVPAVPGTAGVVDLIEKELPDVDRTDLEGLRQRSKNLYQDAFKLLRDRKDSYTANTVVRRAVLSAFSREVTLARSDEEQSEQCAQLEAEHSEWQLPQGVDDLGAIIAAGLARAGNTGIVPGPGDKRFSSIHLTTNFDPLLAISVRKRDRPAIPAPTDKDRPLPSRDRQSCAIVHLHGRWDAKDTLHVDLNTERPLLEGSLIDLLNESTLVVLGYGGWDDVLMRALEAAGKQNQDLDVLWGFYELDPVKIAAQHKILISTLRTSLMTRVHFYRGIDTNSLFHDLRRRILPQEFAKPRSSTPPGTDKTPPPFGPGSVNPPPGASKHATWLKIAGAAAIFGVLIFAVFSKPKPLEPVETGSATSTVATSAPIALPAPTLLKVSCLLPEPKPKGTLTIGDKTFSVEQICGEEKQSLAADSPLLALKTGSVPFDDRFYSASVKHTDGELRFEFALKPNIEVSLKLAGACGRGRFHVGAQNDRKLLAPVREACKEAKVTVPSSWLGETLTLSSADDRSCSQIRLSWQERDLRAEVQCPLTCSEKCNATLKSDLVGCKNAACRGPWEDAHNECLKKCRALSATNAQGL